MYIKTVAIAIIVALALDRNLLGADDRAMGFRPPRGRIVVEQQMETTLSPQNWQPVDKAFAQIRERNYAAPNLAFGRPIWVIGLSFDPATRHLADCAAEPYEFSNLCLTIQAEESK